MERAVSALGLVVFVGLAFAFSRNRKAVRWRTVLWGLGLQAALAALVIRTPWGFAAFQFVGEIAGKFLDFSDAGARFVFGDKFTDHMFAFKVLPTIIFVSCVTTILYYYGVLQKVVQGIAWLMMKTMGTSGAESLCDANVFVGQTEAPLMIRPYLARLTQSELHAIMVGGFAHMAAGVIVVYMSFGVPKVHLIAAAVMAAPGALAIAKLLFPEDGEPETRGTVRAHVERPWVNGVDAAASGASDGMKLCLNVGAMLIAFLALLALVNALLGWGGGLAGMPQLSLEWLFARLFAPVAWLIGVPWSDCGTVGVLLGKKTALNEFIAYLDMKTLLDNAKLVASGAATAGSVSVLSERATVLATYALAGFANISSIGIQIGGIGGLVPDRQHDLARLGARALAAGALTNLVSACIAGILW